MISCAFGFKKSFSRRAAVFLGPTPGIENALFRFLDIRVFPVNGRRIPRGIARINNYKSMHTSSRIGSCSRTTRLSRAKIDSHDPDDFETFGNRIRRITNVHMRVRARGYGQHVLILSRTFPSRYNDPRSLPTRLLSPADEPIRRTLLAAARGLYFYSVTSARFCAIRTTRMRIP